VSTIIARTGSDQAVVFLLHWTDAWELDGELELFRIGLEIGCRITFPDGDPRTKKILGYFHEHPLDWTLIEGPSG